MTALRRPGRRTSLALLAAGFMATPAVASWRIAGPGGLDYGPRSLVSPEASGGFSCLAVVKLDEPIDGDRVLIDQTDAAGLGWRLFVDHQVEGTLDERRLVLDTVDAKGTRTTRASEVAIETGAWVAVTASYGWAPDSPADMRLYVDGVDVTGAPVFDAGLAPADPGVSLTIGAAAADGLDPLQGAIGYVAVWNGVALDGPTHALIAAGADPRTIAPTSLALFARLEETNAIDLQSGDTPVVAADAVFDTDRWPGAKPFIATVGDPAPSSITIVTHAGRVATHAIAYSIDESFDTVSPGLVAEESSDFVVAHALDGLAPATTYHYRVLVDGDVVSGSRGTFTTAPDAPADFRFVVSSCTEFDSNIAGGAYARYPHTTFRGIADRDPAFAVHLGDVWYADQGGSDAETAFNAWSMNTVEAFNRKVMQMLSELDFAAFRRDHAMYFMPDDHEFRNNVHETHRSLVPSSRWQRALTRVLNWQFQSNPPRTAAAVGAGGLWYTFSYGGVDFFMLDMRTQRGFNGNPGVGTMLGNTPGVADGQLGELIAWLDASTAPFKVILAPSLISRFGTTGSDSWHVAFPDDQQFVLDAIAAREDVVYFAGDVHWAGATRLAAHPGGNPAHDTYEFVTGTYGGHLSPPAEPDPDLLYTYDGATVTPNRFSYVVVDVTASTVPAAMTVSIISHDSESETETIEYTHPVILSRRTCPGDFDADGTLGFGDLLAVLSGWGPCGTRVCSTDLDGDGAVGFGDLLMLLSQWGPCP